LHLKLLSDRNTTITLSCDTSLLYLQKPWCDGRHGHILKTETA